LRLAQKPWKAGKEVAMKRLAAALAVLAVVLVPTLASAALTWTFTVAFTNRVASAPFQAGGYPVPPGQTAPDPGT
jgi:hypothetical protein